MDKKDRTEWLKSEVNRLEKAIFYEQMADFMDWGAYYKLKGQLVEVKRELGELAA